MSFRTRLTTFFVVIVVLPMIAVGALVFRLIDDSGQGKADARAAGLAGAAASVYLTESSQARLDARSVARRLADTSAADLPAAVRTLQSATGLARLQVRVGRRTLTAGSSRAVAPGSATVRAADGTTRLVTASTLTAHDLVGELTGVAGVEVVVARCHAILASSLPVARLPAQLPAQGSLTLAGIPYRVFTEPLAAFGGGTLRLTTLTDERAAGSESDDRLLAIIAIGAFLLLAFFFTVLSARQLSDQLRRFLDAARRLAGGDFSEPVPIEGSDEFAALGQEFNRMSSQLEQRLAELTRERARLRESLVRTSQAFASNLNRRRLLELALHTGLEAVEASAGRITVRFQEGDPLTETVRDGELDPFGPQLLAAERAALDAAPGGAENHPAIGEAPGDHGVMALTLGALQPSGRVRGVMTFVRPRRRYEAADRELLASLAGQAALALENVELHDVVSRQAVTDELTGLANHGSFQERLAAEFEQVRRYHHPLALIMVDVDNFKRVNDTYGHQQGDLVLQEIAETLRENSRDVDTPARYGGEELALVLPHTDLDGAFVIAERVRSEIEALQVPRLDGRPPLCVTASLGVAATAGELAPDELIAEADAALYRAKHGGKNRTERATPAAARRTAGVAGGE